MIISAKFKYNGKYYKYTFTEKELDRNYQDEDCAYKIVRQHIKSGVWFEINLLKTDCDNDFIFENDGYVAVYESIVDVNPVELINMSFEFR